jgi:outer membrane protein
VDWDVQLALTVPLYAGGSLQSQVREALSQSTQAELSTSQARRQAEQEIRAVYQSVVFDRSRLVALEKATESARKNYEVQRHDYRLGLVTNLDVLQALTAFQENQRALDRARYIAKLDYLRLEAAAARRPAAPGGTTP